MSFVDNDSVDVKTIAKACISVNILPIDNQLHMEHKDIPSERQKWNRSIYQKYTKVDVGLFNNEERSDTHKNDLSKASTLCH